MSRPQPKHCTALIQHNLSTVRCARYGHAPLIHLWVHEEGEGGRGIVLDVAQVEQLIDGLADICDDIEGITPNSKK